MLISSSDHEEGSYILSCSPAIFPSFELPSQRVLIFRYHGFSVFWISTFFQVPSRAGNCLSTGGSRESLTRLTSLSTFRCGVWATGRVGNLATSGWIHLRSSFLASLATSDPYKSSLLIDVKF